MTDNLINALEVAAPRLLARSILTFRVPAALDDAFEGVTHGKSRPPAQSNEG